MDIKYYLIELIGIYIFVFSNLYFNNAIITGLTLILIISLGHLMSYDGHYNAAVSLSKYLDNSISISEFTLSLSLQLLGGYLGYKTYKFIK
jgi:hypothetical protein